MPSLLGYELNNIISINKQDEIASIVVSQFSDFNIMFHYENVTCYDIDAIMRYRCDNRSYFMINYDTHPERSRILKRPPGYKYLHVVLLLNYQTFDR